MHRWIFRTFCKFSFSFSVQSLKCRKYWPPLLDSKVEFLLLTGWIFSHITSMSYSPDHGLKANVTRLIKETLNLVPSQNWYILANWLEITSCNFTNPIQKWPWTASLKQARDYRILSRYRFCVRLHCSSGKN